MEKTNVVDNAIIKAGKLYLEGAKMFNYLLKKDNLDIEEIKALSNKADNLIFKKRMTFKQAKKQLKI